MYKQKSKQLQKRWNRLKFHWIEETIVLTIYSNFWNVEVTNGHSYTNAIMKSMNIFTASMKSKYFYQYEVTGVFIPEVYFFLSYVIRMKEFERVRRLDERAAKANHQNEKKKKGIGPQYA